MKKIIILLMVLLTSNVYAQTKVVVIPMFDEVAATSWLGTWEADKDYKANDVIEYGGSSYIALVDHTSDLTNYPPDETYWELMAASGATGPEGPPGPQGDPGVVDQATLDYILGKFPRTVFVTSTAYDGDLVSAASGLPGPPSNGIDAADALCQNHADTAGRSESFKSWISDESSSPSTRFYKSTSQYILTDGITIIAGNWADLIANESIRAPINLDEFGNVPAATVTWTNTKTTGVIDDRDAPLVRDCAGWTSSDSSGITRGFPGFVSSSGSTWTETSRSIQCSVKYRLYCFEQ